MQGTDVDDNQSPHYPGIRAEPAGPGDDGPRDHRAMSGAHRSRQPAPQCLHSRHGRRSAPAGARGRPRDRGGPRPWPAARRPGVHQGSHRRSRDADVRRVARSRGTRRAPGCGQRRAPATRRCGDHRQDQPARVRIRDDERGLGVWSRTQSTRPDPIAGRVERRLGRQPRRRHGAGNDRHRYGRVDSHSRGSVRNRRPETVDRRSDHRRGRASFSHVGSRRPVDAHRD